MVLVRDLTVVGAGIAERGLLLLLLLLLEVVLALMLPLLLGAAS